MPIALYMDENVPKEYVTDELRKQGVDVITIQEDGLMGASDSDILDRATQLERVVFTYDLNFLQEALRRFGSPRVRGDYPIIFLTFINPPV